MANVKPRRILLIGVGRWGVNHLRIKTFENRHVAENGEIRALEGTMHQLEFPLEEPLRAELATFVDSIERRTASPVDGWAGFDAVRLVEAALDSARTGAWIDISNESRSL